MMRVSINDNFTERKFILLFQNVSIIFSNFMGWSLKPDTLSNPEKSERFYKRFDRAPRPIVMIKVSKFKEWFLFTFLSCKSPLYSNGERHLTPIYFHIQMIHLRFKNNSKWSQSLVFAVKQEKPTEVAVSFLWFTNWLI